MILCWHFMWNASNCFVSAFRMVQVSEPCILTSTCRMVLVSEPYVLESACRMAQVSKPYRHTHLTVRAYATLINSEFWRQGETHLAQYTTSLLKLPGRWDALCLVWNIRATLVLTRNRGSRKISDSINNVWVWRIKYSSSKILNLGFLPGSIHSKCTDASWKLESIIDNRSPSHFGQSPRRYFPHETTRDLQRGLLAEGALKTVNGIDEEDWLQMPYKYFLKYLFAVILCWYWNISCLLTCLFTLYLRISCAWCFFLLMRRPTQIPLILLLPCLLQLRSYTYRTFSCRKGTAGCFWSGIAHPVVCKTKGTFFWTKSDSNSAFLSVLWGNW